MPISTLASRTGGRGGGGEKVTFRHPRNVACLEYIMSPAVFPLLPRRLSLPVAFSAQRHAVHVGQQDDTS